MSCSFCYEYGHNRAGCSKRKERVAKARANGESNWLTREADRKDRAKEKRKQFGSKRRCSWCCETGHNRRGCPSMKEAKASYVAHNAAYRQRLYEHMSGQGWGVGALVEVNPEVYDSLSGAYLREPITYLITEVLWGRLNWHQLYGGVRNEVFKLEAIDVPSNHRKASGWWPHPGEKGITTIPDSPYSYSNNDSAEVIRLLSPVSASALEATAPGADWFDGTMALADIFDKELSSWHAERWFSKLEELSDYEFLEKV